MWIFTDDGFVSIVEFMPRTTKVTKPAVTKYDAETKTTTVLKPAETETIAPEFVDKLTDYTPGTFEHKDADGNKVQGQLCSHVLVRARVEADLDPLKKIDPTGYAFTDKSADYSFRLIMKRQKLAEYVAQKVMDIDYDSHVKETINNRAPQIQGGRYSGLSKVWSAIGEWQPGGPYGHGTYSSGYSSSWGTSKYNSTTPTYYQPKFGKEYDYIRGETDPETKKYQQGHYVILVKETETDGRVWTAEEVPEDKRVWSGYTEMRDFLKTLNDARKKVEADKKDEEDKKSDAPAGYGTKYGTSGYQGALVSSKSDGEPDDADDFDLDKWVALNADRIIGELDDDDKDNPALGMEWWEERLASGLPSRATMIAQLADVLRTTGEQGNFDVDDCVDRIQELLGTIDLDSIDARNLWDIIDPPLHKMSDNQKVTEPVE